VLTLLRDRYEVLETLGSGGEARVVKALDRQHSRIVALKIRPVRADVEREDLLAEARLLLAVPPHPALPLVREDFFDGEEYIVAMDWVDGTDLATLLHDRGRPGLAPSSVLSYLAQAAEALTHLHTQSPPVIHGDVKPGNLILTKGGRVKLVDFGLSSARDTPRSVMGTPGYQAPELALGDPPSRATDVYALAATAFALLTGEPPAGILPAWEGISPAQAEQLQDAIRLGLATDPARRPETPGEFVERLRVGWSAGLPSGVVTFCMSDIEGSTALWDAHPEAMAEALVTHDELIVDAVEAHGGSVVQTMGEGDSIVSVFDSAPGAVAAAYAANCALAAQQWPPDISIAVRWGLHTGEIERRGTEFRGTTIIVAARLRAQADGGQIFLSSVTSELVASHLPEGCELVDLGPHRLKGLAAPERIRALKGPGVDAPLSASECPYRGLLAFEADDREFFFGRERVVADMLARLASGRLLAVVGASGSGKSSVLRAGVLAAVQASEVSGLNRTSLLTPTAEPALGVPDEPDRLVVVDQFEELFTVCQDADRRLAFIDELLNLRCVVVIGVRADLYGRLSEHGELARAVAANQVLLGAMSDVELERAITEPARRAGLKLEPGLVELVLRDVAAEPGALPLLSHALRATWERRDGRTLTVEGYRDSGGVASAIARTADAVVDALPEPEQQLTRGVFLRMTELGEGIQDTRRRVTIEELVPEQATEETVRNLVERLADARLVMLDENSAEVAHEALIREWPRLRGWLDEDRAGIRIHRQLSQAARLWDSGGREPSDLYRGARLAGAVELSQADSAGLNATERAFLDASIAEADRERRAQARSNRRLRALLSVAVLLLVAAIGAGVLAIIQRDHARAQALTSDAERVGAQALTDPNPDHSLLLAVAGVELQNRLETRSDLFADLQQNAALIRLIHPSDIEISALRVSPDGHLLAVGDESGTVRFINLQNWKPAGPTVQLGSPVAERAMSFSADGRTLVALTTGATRAHLYAIDIGTRRARQIEAWNGVAPLEPIGFEAVAYSPDGRYIAVTHDTEPTSGNYVPLAASLLLLDAASGRVRWQRKYPLLPGEGDPFVAWTPSGTLLTSGQQGDTLLWNPRTGEIVRHYRLGGLPAISPNGATVALGQNSPSSANQSSAVTLLDLRTGGHRTLLGTLPNDWIRSLAFTPDATELAGAAIGGLHVWDLATGKIVESYSAGTGYRTNATLDTTGDTLISGQQDGSITAFDLSGHRRLGREFSWPGIGGCAGNPCMAFSRQSDLMATDRADGTVAIVDLRTLAVVRTLPALDGATTAAISFMPDGRTLVTGGVNRRVTFWDVATGRVTRTLRFPQAVWWTASSPNGKLLAVQTSNNAETESPIEVVQVATGKVLQRHNLADGPGGVEFTPDGRTLVGLGCCWTGSGSALTAWDARTGRQLFSLGSAIDAEAFDIATDSRLLGVGTGGGDVLLLDPRTGKRLAPPIRVAAGEISQVSFSPDGRTLAAASLDHTVSVWDLQSRSRLGDPFGPYPGEPPFALFEPDGRLFIMALTNAIQWPMDVNTWERFACQVAGRTLKRQEWHDLLPNRPYRKVCPAAG
jgi:WD40 repeat protein/class 3 adenylate cyclase/tRNA A-37 threonylcarbamoyl transferase component Bud32/energy-coupling factor transporter ATP-binding protein EcfA2